MRTGIKQATVRVFEPDSLAAGEKERLLAALEGFLNLGNSLTDFKNFGRQDVNFFPVRILDESTQSETPLPPPVVKGCIGVREGASATDLGKPVLKTVWTKMLAWESACQEMALLYRGALWQVWGALRDAWNGASYARLYSGEALMFLLGIAPPAESGDWQTAFAAIKARFPNAKPILPEISRLVPDMQTGTFDYMPDNDFQRAVYILFREGWRAKTCARCSRRFLAGKPRQLYCSTKCFDEVKRERGNQWWSAHGKRWRTKRAAEGAGAATRKKSRSRKRTPKGAK